MPKIALDADYLIFQMTEGKDDTDMFPGERTKAKNIKPLKKRMKEEIKRIEQAIAANLPGEVSGIKPFFSDPNGNFRYDIYSEYKNNRKGSERSKEFYLLREWAHKKWGYFDGVEADDVVAHYVRKGWIGASFDKDLLQGVPGVWFDTYHSRQYIIKTNKKNAIRFNFLQTLAGDSTDNIKGIPRVGMVTAEKLLATFGCSWEGVVMAYESKGLTLSDAILTRRLICMNQWTPKHGVRLFNP